ncbi:MAG TPA: hypothetical protein VLX92_02870 [Kofleriaceae bacterium]|nr:hypothetical protein [Kofleriaceae bacterium]
MTNSRSSTSRSRWIVAIAALVLWTGLAHAGGRKRIVVLDFEGPHADQFHEDLVKLIKKHHTVVPTDKWNGVAEDLDAAKITEKNVKKVARKLKIDGVVEGRIEKRRDEYIVQLKLRAGGSGELVGNRVDTRADGPKLDGQASRDIKDELIGAIDELEANHGGDSGDDDTADDDSGSKKHKKVADDGDDDDSGSSKKKAKKDKKVASDDDGDDDSSSKHGAFSKRAERGGDKVGKSDKSDDDDSDDSASTSKKKKDKKVAKSDDDDSSTSTSAEAELPAQSSADQVTPGNRAIDASLGLSFTARHMTFQSASGLSGSQVPSGYKQSIPVAGAFFDGVVYPLAIGHKRAGLLTGIGIELMYDKVLKINSQKQYVDMDMNKTATLDTIEERAGVGAVFRYPINQQLNVGAKLEYQSQTFQIAQSLPDGSATDIPNVKYQIISPRAFGQYTIMPRLVAEAEGAVLLITGVGAIGTSSEYGRTKSSGFEGDIGAEYELTRSLFVRASFRLEEISLKFASDPSTLANNRDTDSSSQDVFGAKDLYFGGQVTVGYLY